jgi:Transglutaminase-like superfamily
MQATDRPELLAFYVRPAMMTSAGRYTYLFDGLPRDIDGLTDIAQGLLIHEHMVAGYGVTLSEAEQATVHERRVERLLAQLVARDDRPLDVARDPAGRLAANCRHFTVLMAAMLRAQGVPARARCGFGTYFGTGVNEDHWVCEYWNAGQDRWVLVDAQIDDRQRGWFPIDFDVTDVPRDRFLVGGQAWQQCRSGAADPDTFGLSVVNETGYWWVASNLMRDAMALLNLEVLPWDDWGAMPGPDKPVDVELAGLLDRLAVLTIEPDASLAELEHLCYTDDRIRIPGAVHNYVRDRYESLFALTG